jgi:hypothetical protein
LLIATLGFPVVSPRSILFQSLMYWPEWVMLGSLGVQGPSVALGALTASLLKTVPFAGQFAGGMLQGVVQALITKWVGAVFIEYFRNEMQLPEGGLAALARRQWEQLTTADELRKLISTAREKLAQKEPA